MTRFPPFSIEHKEVCKGCSLGKYVRTAFSKSDTRFKGALDMINLDIYGPMSYPYIGGNFKYYISFNDELSKKTWIYFLTGKK